METLRTDWNRKNREEGERQRQRGDWEIGWEACHFMDAGQFQLRGTCCLSLRPYTQILNWGRGRRARQSNGINPVANMDPLLDQCWASVADAGSMFSGWLVRSNPICMWPRSLFLRIRTCGHSPVTNNQCFPRILFRSLTPAFGDLEPRRFLGIIPGWDPSGAQSQTSCVRWRDETLGNLLDCPGHRPIIHIHKQILGRGVLPLCSLIQCFVHGD